MTGFGDAITKIKSNIGIIARLKKRAAGIMYIKLAVVIVIKKYFDVLLPYFPILIEPNRNRIAT
jgi:hypothetical protein